MSRQPEIRRIRSRIHTKAGSLEDQVRKSAAVQFQAWRLSDAWQQLSGHLVKARVLINRAFLAL